MVNPICVWSQLEVATLAVSAASPEMSHSSRMRSQNLTLWPTERQLQLIASLLELGATAFAVCGTAASDLERQAVKETATKLIATSSWH